MFENCTVDLIKNNLKSKDKFEPYPKIGNRDFWDNISDELKEKLNRQVKIYADLEIPSLSASLYMDYFKTGDRVKYEEKYFQRREMLTCLTIAECVENKGLYIDKIIDLIWAVCEETTWSVPAHIYVTPDNADVNVGILPNIEKEIFDLFAGETSSLIACCCYILRSRLDEVSPMIVKRMEIEIKKRIINPYLEHHNYLWMLFKRFDGVLINNWTPWCTSNAIISILLIEEDEQKRVAAIKKALQSLDMFVETYDEEGGCDEGPGYWYKASGCVFDILYMIYLATDGKINLFKNNTKLLNMANYISKMHISGNYFVSYADGEAKCGFLPQKLYLFGEYVESQQLKSLGLYLLNYNDKKIHTDINLYQMLMGVCNYDALKNIKLEVYKREDAFLKDLQIACVSEENGFFLSVKGGNNGESHNHNDVGNFVVYYKGSPIIVDMGVGNYTKRHWGAERYEIFTMMSSYHNLPVVNGYEEVAGKEKSASDMEYVKSDDGTKISMNIEKSFDSRADISLWKRKILFNKDGITLIDNAEFNDLSDVSFNFITPIKPVVFNDAIKLNDVNMHFDMKKFDITFERIEGLDTKLKRSWKDGLYRIILKLKKKVSVLENRIEFQ